MIVLFWGLLIIVAMALKAQELIPRMPKQLMQTAMQVCGIWTGGTFSKDALNAKRSKKRKI
jgi:hypothetical protein